MARLTASVVLLAIVVGVPFALVHFVGTPWPDLDALQASWRDGRLDDDTVIRVCASISLLLWGWFALTAVAEVLRVLRWRSVKRAVPLVSVPSSPSGLVRRLVRIALLTSVVASSSGLPGVAMAAGTGSVGRPLSAGHEVGTAWEGTTLGRDPSPGVGLPSWSGSIDASVTGLPSSGGLRATSVIEAETTLMSTGRETPYSIAARLGDTGLRQAVIELNSGRPTPGGGMWTGGVFPEGMVVHVPAPTESGSAEWAVYAVQPGDSVYGIAEDLTSGSSVSIAAVASEIIDHNMGRTMADGRAFERPDLIRVGWQLEVPVEADVSATVPTVETGPATNPTIGGPLSPSIGPALDHVVERGDSYWGIAERYLEDVAGEVAPSEIAAFTNALIDANAPLLGHDDPAMLWPGEVVRWPGAIAEPPAPPAHDPAEAPLPPSVPPIVDAPAVEASTVDVPESASESVPEAAVPSAPASSSVTPSTDRIEPTVPLEPTVPVGVTPAESVPVVGTSPAAGSAAPAATSATTDADRVAGPPVSAVAGDDESGSISLGMGLGGAFVLGAGALAMIDARRRQRLRRAQVGHRLLPPAEAAVRLERSLRRLGSAERAMRVDLVVRAVASVLVPLGRHVIAVILEDDGRMEIRLDDAAAPPSPPWEPGDDASTWVLPAAVSAMDLVDDARQSDQPCPAMVQIGSVSKYGRTGGALLVDLEAMGLLCVVGGADRVAAVIRAATSALAVSPFTMTTVLLTVGLEPSASLGQPQVEAVSTLDAALDLAATCVGSIATLSAGRRTFALRASAVGGESWEPTIVIADGRPLDDLDRDLLAMTGDGGRGLGVLVAGLVSGCRWVFEERADGGWRLDELGVDVVPLGLDSSTMVELADLVEDAQVVVEDEHLADADDGATDRDDASVDNDFAERPWTLMVRLLGGVDVIDVHGTAVSFERQKSLELVAWLSQHRQRPTRTAARTALWETDVRDASFANVVSDARRALARRTPPPHQQEWIERTLTEHLPLHVQVVSDADLVEDRVRAARGRPACEAIEILRPAVELITDLPFSGTGYLWPDAEGITSSLTLLATGAASELARCCLQAGDIEGVFWATGQGLKALPGHEELIALRMRAHAQAGDLAGVRQEWTVYERALHADPWSRSEPSPKLVAVRHELLTSA